MARLLEVAAARQQIQLQWPVPIRQLRPVEQSLGWILGEEIRAASDSPPYDKAMVDGYAFHSSEIQGETISLRVTAEILAGTVSAIPVVAGTTQRIMTGAPLPEGADTVVMVERTEFQASDGMVTIDVTGATPGQNILRRASVIRRGDHVLSSGHPLRAVDAGIVAEAGRSEVLVFARPRVAFFQTGDEIVKANQEPGPAQIRNSNGPLLYSLLRQHVESLDDLGIVVDEEDALRSAIARGLTADVLVMTGGVSQGVRDLVPGLLREAGVDEVFHRVAMKPGKPLWFGVHARDGHRTLVFGLPGNPVSSLVGGLLFVVPTLWHMQGRGDVWESGWQAGKIVEPFTTRGEVTTYWPCELVGKVESLFSLKPLPWRGSADLFTFARAQALMEIPASKSPYPAGTSVRWRRVP